MAKEPGLFRDIDMVLCSSSTRTRETLEEVNGCLSDNTMVSYIDALYHASSEVILEELRFVADNFNSVLVVAHNPGLTQFLHHVCECHGQSMDKSMKTGSLAEFSVQLESWHSLEYADLKFIRMIRS